MKKFVKIALITLLLATCVFAVVACNDKAEISVSQMPQMVFVKGNDLDLSAGKLTVVAKKKQSVVDLNAAGVTVTGYDKNTVGEQTLTISYGGASTTLTVEVVERMTAKNHVTEYVVGEAFNKAGLLEITRNNGEKTSVFLSDERLSFNGFDSSTAGDKTVSVIYKDDSDEFIGGFPVKVYAAEQVKFTAPKKRAYNSHDEGYDLSGGYLTVTANGGALEKTILLNESMLPAFDTSMVTEDKPSVTQTVNVEYYDWDFSYNIEIKLTDVTRIKNNAKTLSALDWSGSAASPVTEAQGNLAIASVRMYNGLSSENAKLISDGELLALARPALVYGYAKWTERAELFSVLFEASKGRVTVNCDDYATTAQAFATVSAFEDDDILFEYADLLIGVVAKFAQTELYGDVKMGAYMTDICTSKAVKEAIEKIDLMLKMHKSLQTIPSEWQLSDLLAPANADKIEEAHAYVVELSEIIGENAIYERDLFNTVSSWRQGKNDYFEILYRYYFQMFLNEDEDISRQGQKAIDEMIDVCLPGMMETYYLQYIKTMLDLLDLTGDLDGNPAADIDTFVAIVDYRNLLKIRDSILESEDEMYITLFDDAYNMGNLIAALQTADTGIFALLGSAYGEPAFEAMWDKYIEVAASLGDTIAASGDKIEDMFRTFIALTPEFQAQFIASLNPYGSYEFSPSDGTDRTPYFIELLIYYYSDIMPKNLLSQNDENGIVFELFDALQYYIVSNHSGTKEESAALFKLFLDSMGAAEKLYGELSVSDKALFDEHIGFFYEAYMNIYKKFDAQGKFVEKTISDEWKENITALEDMYKALANLLVAVVQDYTRYPLLVSAYELTVDLYNEIMTTAPQDVIDIVLYQQSEIYDDIIASLETYLYQYRSVYMSCLSSYPVNNQYVVRIWDRYQESNIREYMSSLSGFYLASYLNDGSLTMDIVKEAISGFYALSDDSKSLFFAMDGFGQFMYFKGMKSFFAKEFSGDRDLLSAANAMLDIELSYMLSMSDMGALTEDEFAEAWEEIEVRYSAFTADEKQKFDEAFKAAYDYYKAIYDEIKASQQN